MLIAPGMAGICHEGKYSVSRVTIVQGIKVYFDEMVQMRKNTIWFKDD